jgi:GDP-4-dehydro-6-deoxy-D-mannose reductase
MTALVTGSSGFVGRHLVHHLREGGHQVATLGRRGEHAIDAACSRARLAEVLAAVAPRFVFHLAAVTVPSSPEEAYRVNTLYAANLLAAAASLDPPPVAVLIGSAAEYGPSRSGRPLAENDPWRPSTLYGVTKLAQTLHGLAETRVPVVVLRLFNLIGPGQPPHLAPRAFIRQALAGARKIEVEHLDQVRDYVAIADVVRAILRFAAEPRARGRVLNLCSGHGVRIGELLDAVARGVAPGLIGVSRNPAAGGGSHIVGDPAAAASLGILLPPADLDASVAAMVAAETL